MSKERIQTTADPVELERKMLAEGDGPASTGTNAEEELVWPDGRWTFVRKVAIAISMALIVGYLILWAQNVQDTGGPEGYIRGNSNRGPVDFVSTLTGALVIRDGNGQNLYILNAQTNAQNRIFAGYRPQLSSAEILPYNHLPFEAIAVAPVMGLPYPIVFALWTLLCGIAIGMSLGLLDGALPVARPVGWVLSLAACSYLPLIRGLMLGQNSPLVLLGLCGLYANLKRGQENWAGAALVLVAFKPQILPIILLLLVLQQRWRTLGIFAAIMGGLSILSMPILGIGWPLQYIGLLLGVAGWGSTGAINPAIMHNWRGFLTNLLGPQSSNLIIPLFILLSLLTAGVVAWAWWRSRHTVSVVDANAQDNYRPPRTGRYASQDTHLEDYYTPGFDLLWALAGIAAMLTSLHLNPHDLTLLVFPAWIIGAYATSGVWGRGLSRLWIGILSLGYILAPFILTNTVDVVIPSVLLMAFAVVLLAWHLANPSAEEAWLVAVPT